MDAATIRSLCAINNDFYQVYHESFSQTRSDPWPGWQLVAEDILQLLPDKCEGAELDASCGQHICGKREEGACEPVCGPASKLTCKAADEPTCEPISKSATSSIPALRVCDIACGNMRFERFLLDKYPKVEWQFCASDACDDLALSRAHKKTLALFRENEVASAPESLGGMKRGIKEDLAALVCESGATRATTKEVDCMRYTAVCESGVLKRLKDCVSYVQNDSIASLLEGKSLSMSPDFRPASFDALVSFGFMHHIPSAKLRLLFIEKALELVKPGGVLALSFWQFAYNDALERKAKITTEQALKRYGLDIEDGDYFLGWQNSQKHFRYCHSFSNAELDEILAYFQDGDACFTSGEMMDEKSSKTQDEVAREAPNAQGRPKARLLRRFTSDGRTQNMNSYLVFRRI